MLDLFNFVSQIPVGQFHFITFITFCVLIFTTSLLGSAHCSMMCGPIMLSFGMVGIKTFYYHIGRLLGYLSVTFLAFHLGSFLFNQTLIKIMPFISAWLLGFSLILMGMFYLTGVSNKISYFWGRVFNKFIQIIPKEFYFKKTKSSYFPFLMGLLSVFLPCGWLYGFIFLALVLNNFFLASVVIFTFWLGTLPAFSVLTVAISKFQKNKISMAVKSLIGILMVFIGVFTIIEKINFMPDLQTSLKNFLHNKCHY